MVDCLQHCMLEPMRFGCLFVENLVCFWLLIILMGYFICIYILFLFINNAAPPKETGFFFNHVIERLI